MERFEIRLPYCILPTSIAAVYALPSTVIIMNIIIKSFRGNAEQTHGTDM